MRKRIDTPPETLVDLENLIARATVEIEFYKHHVGARKWPKVLYEPPSFIVREGESRQPGKRPFSSYQASFDAVF